jgi:hypothetical protein
MVPQLVDYSALLTVTYLWTENDNLAWRQEFLDCFKDTGITPVQCIGYLGDLQRGRIEAYQSVTTPYVFMADPDDLVDMQQIFRCIDFLEAHPTYAGCAVREERINSLGQSIGRNLNSQVSAEQVYMSPTAFHNGAVLRTEAVKAVLPLFDEMNFHLFDWALRICLVNRAPLHLLPEFGYSYRLHQQGHRVSARNPKAIPAFNTVAELINVGAITLSKSSREAIGLD